MRFLCFVLAIIFSAVVGGVGIAAVLLNPSNTLVDRAVSISLLLGAIVCFSWACFKGDEAREKATKKSSGRADIKETEIKKLVVYHRNEAKKAHKANDISSELFHLREGVKFIGEWLKLKESSEGGSGG